MRFCYTESPLGELLLAGTDQGLARLIFPQGRMAQGPEAGWLRDDGLLPSVRRQLDEYFSGERHTFNVSLVLETTPFRRRVLAALMDIPYGETRSYAQIAVAVGNRKAVRAVGSANGRNPIPIIIPCHRVIGSDGQLTGFGGGLDAKRQLLALEGVTANSC